MGACGRLTKRNPSIPVFDPVPQFDQLRVELLRASERVLSSGAYILGEEVEAFETEVAAYLGVRHAVGVNSGTDALTMALRAVGVEPGQEVITTTFTFFATAESIHQAGAIPVLVDIDPGTFNIDPRSVELAMSERTAAIVPVHLFGRPAVMAEILGLADRHGVPVVEDAAQSFGARVDGRPVGSLGRAGGFSFFPSKNLSGFGDGGLIATNDDDIAEVSRMLRIHGSKRKYFNEAFGYNSRLDELQAALLRVKLPHVDRWNEQRRDAAAVYSKALLDQAGIVVPQSSDGHVFHQYTIRVEGGRRDDLAKHLHGEDISTAAYYPTPLHRLPALTDLPHRELPHADEAAAEVLSLPLWPGMDTVVQERVVSGIRRALSS